MSEFYIHSHRIMFPYASPYPTQKAFMNKVLMALTKAENALLESPTGSGKTLSLLCSALAYQAKNPLKKIIFTSRTHSQLKQIVRELRTTDYKVKATVLGSRNHLCINEEVKEAGTNINDACCKLNRGSPNCEFRDGAKAVSGCANEKNPIWDIEDLVAKGKEKTGCPYYAAREIADDASLILAPYNYVLDPVIRKSMNIGIRDAIVIIDEAHNVESCCSEAASAELKSEEFGMVVSELKKMKGVDNNNDPRINTALEIIGGMVHWLNDRGGELPVVKFETEGSVSKDAEILRFWSDVSVTPETYAAKLYGLKGVCEIKQSDLDSLLGDEPALPPQCLSFIEKVSMLIEFMFSNIEVGISSYRLVLLKKASPEPGSGPPWELKMCFWCLNPALAFDELGKTTHSVILTSGTLSPLESFQSELGVQFPHKLEASHVVDESQLFIRTLGVGPSGRRIVATYSNTEEFAFQDEVGHLLKDTLDVITSGGVLVFLSSYGLLEKLQKRWTTTGLLRSLSAGESCKVFTEPRSVKQFGPCMTKYMNHLRNPMNKAMFFAVCRGKISEGVDFADQYARAVITIGIPFPAAKDLRVLLKQQYNDIQVRTKKSNTALSGRDWYSLQAFRALNQALGRCVRHKNDYGAILIVDDRFRSEKTVSSISKWICQNIRFGPGIIARAFEFQSMKQDLVEFLEKNQLKFPPKVDKLELLEFDPGCSADERDGSPLPSQMPGLLQSPMLGRQEPHFPASTPSEASQTPSFSIPPLENDPSLVLSPTASQSKLDIADSAIMDAPPAPNSVEDEKSLPINSKSLFLESTEIAVGGIATPAPRDSKPSSSQRLAPEVVEILSSDDETQTGYQEPCTGKENSPILSAPSGPLCCSCGQCFIDRRDAAKIVVLDSYLTIGALASAKSSNGLISVFSVPFSKVPRGSLVAVNSPNYPELINCSPAFWSESDKKCYFPLHCSNCQKLVAFRIAPFQPSTVKELPDFIHLLANRVQTSPDLRIEPATEDWINASQPPQKRKRNRRQ